MCKKITWNNLAKKENKKYLNFIQKVIYNRKRKKIRRNTQMKKERGITLVSLVVTIIVLIILAGVSLNAVVGDNGIITIAKEQKNKIEEVGKKEANELAMLEEQL